MRLPWKRLDPAAAAEEVKRRAIALNLGAPLAIRVNPRARRLLLRIDAAARTIELVLPHGIPAEHGLKFLDAQRGWIAARLDALPQTVPFMEGAVVPVFGVPHRIRHFDDPKAPPVTIVGRESISKVRPPRRWKSALPARHRRRSGSNSRLQRPSARPASAG